LASFGFIIGALNVEIHVVATGSIAIQKMEISIMAASPSNHRNYLSPKVWRYLSLAIDDS